MLHSYCIDSALCNGFNTNFVYVCIDSGAEFRSKRRPKWRKCHPSMLFRWHEKSFIQLFCWESWLSAEFLTFSLDVWETMQGRNGVDFQCSRSVAIFPVRTEFSDDRGKRARVFADFSSMYRRIANIDRKWTMETREKITQVRKRKIYKLANECLFKYPRACTCMMY